MENEVWKDIKGFEGRYQVSNQGRIKSLIGKSKPKGYILKPMNNGNGYYHVTLRDGKRSSQRRIHTIVAETFVDNPMNLKEINHINEDKSDNRAENLEWVLHRENMYHGTLRVRQRIHRGLPVAQIENGVIIAIYDSASDAAKAVGASITTICACCKGFNGKSEIASAYGYQWVRLSKELAEKYQFVRLQEELSE